jgi:putative NADH-flavin reductase
MATLLVIGATRGIGREVVDMAVEHGHQVRAFARGAASIPEGPRLEPWPGDATNSEDLRPAVEGVDGVVMSLGLPKSLSFIYRPTRLFSSATAALLPVMEKAKVKRLLVVTGFGAGKSRDRISALERIPFHAVFGRAYADKSRQEALIEASDLNWTIVRPGVLTNGPETGVYQVLENPESWRNGVIARKEVARFLLTAFELGSHVKEAPVLVR